MSASLRALVALTMLFAVGAVSIPAHALSDQLPMAPGPAPAWSWPISPMTIVAPFIAPAHSYGPGHRGIDISASLGTPLVSPADGVVAFSGMVAGRPVLTIDHGAGLVTTLEPVQSETVAGSRVHRGDVIGTATFGGHAPAGSVHFGVREHGEYINPMLLVATLDRAVLLPCCS